MMAFEVVEIQTNLLSKVAYVCDGKVVETVFRGLSRLGEYVDMGQAGQGNTAAGGKKPNCRSPLSEDTPPT